jgi:hypothetical protein
MLRMRSLAIREAIEAMEEMEEGVSIRDNGSPAFFAWAGTRRETAPGIEREVQVGDFAHSPSQG